MVIPVVAQVPYDKKSTIPAKARLKTYICLEINRLIMIWHHVEDEEPSWIPPTIPEVVQTPDSSPCPGTRRGVVVPGPDTEHHRLPHPGT